MLYASLFILTIQRLINPQLKCRKSQLLRIGGIFVTTTFDSSKEFPLAKMGNALMASKKLLTEEKKVTEVKPLVL